VIVIFNSFAMTTHPAQLLILLSLGLGTLAIMLTAAFLLYQLCRKQTVHVVRPSNGANGSFATISTPRWTSKGRWILATMAVLMLLWVFAGKYLIQLFFSNADRVSARFDFVQSEVKGSSGANLVVARSGSGEGPTLLFTHGWGADHQDWSYVIASLKNQFPVVAWDLPGLGKSTPASDYAMKTLAGDLDSVVSSIEGPVIIVGHSIGGILNIEYARQFPEKLNRQVKGFVQVNTTYTNPVETKKGADTSRKLQKPLYEPLLHVVTWSSPVARGLGWLAYRSGLAHLQLARQSFAGNETWGQLDHMASYAYRSSPGVVSQGVLGMLQWDGSDVLKTISVPTLIVSGNEDVTTLPLASDRMERDIAMANRISVPGAAHLGPVEQHELYADAIRTFVMQSNRRVD
jgi:pimeloyl-ACP methyl ester carboxylesterase